MKLNARNLVPIGLLIYLCGAYLGNITKLVGIGIFIIMTIWNIKPKVSNYYAKYQAFFWVYVSLSFLWAHKTQLNTTIATLEVVTTFAFFYMAVVLYQYTEDENDVINLMNTFLMSLVFLTVYLLLFTPFSYWGTAYIGRNLGLHKNEIGMNYAWGTLMCFYLSRNQKSNRWIYLILLVVFSGLSLVAGSRKAVVIIALGIILYLILNEKNIKALINILIGVAFIIAGYYLIISIPALNELLGDRMVLMLRTLTSSSTVSITEDKSIWERSFYRSYAMQMFTENPFSFVFGHGLDGFRTRMAEIGYNHVAYSHCNYTELLADYGLIGFCLYYIFKFRLIINAFKFKERKSITTFFMIVLGVGIITEYGMVSYYEANIQFCMLLSFLAIVKVPSLEGNFIKLRMIRIKRNGRILNGK